MRSVVLLLQMVLYILNSQVSAIEWCYFCNITKKCEPPFEKIKCTHPDYYLMSNYTKKGKKPTWACYILRSANPKQAGFVDGKPRQERACVDTSSKLDSNIQKYCKNSSPIICSICNTSNYCNSEVLKKFNKDGTPLGVSECNSCSDPICLEDYTMTCAGSHLVKYFCAIYKKPGHEIRQCEYSDSKYKKTCQEFEKRDGACRRCEKDRCNADIKASSGGSTFKSHRFAMAYIIFVGLFVFF